MSSVMTANTEGKCKAWDCTVTFWVSVEGHRGRVLQVIKVTQLSQAFLYGFHHKHYTRQTCNDGEGNGTHSSTLAWKIPWMEDPGGLQSMGSLRVGHDWATSLSLFTFMHWRRKWQPTPVFLPGESQGRGSLLGCCLWGHTESDTTEAT